MFRLFLITLLLTGCATTQNKPLSDANKISLGKIGVISTIGDDLLCSYRGLTIFTNEENNYQIPNQYNELLTSEITQQLSSLNYTATGLDSSLISYKKPKKGASSFSNIKFNEASTAAGKFDTLVIYDGSFHYSSTGGYYARNNALNTEADLYVYNLTSKKLIAVSSKFRTDLKRHFSCKLSELPPKSDMLELIKKSGLENQKELVNSVFNVNQ